MKDDEQKVFIESAAWDAHTHMCQTSSVLPWATKMAAIFLSFPLEQ